MKLIFIRHGEPNYEKKTLTPQGFKEAEALRKMYENYPFDEVYVSPLNRAQLTCLTTLKNTKNKIVTLDFLTEFTHQINVPYKNETVLTWDFMPSFFSKQSDFYNKDTYLDNAYLKTGNIKTHYEYVINSFDKLLKEHGYIRDNLLYKVEKENKDTLVFFCHFGITCVILSHLLNIPYVLLAQSFCALPSSVTEVVTEEREKGVAQFRCIRFGDLSHLRVNNVEESFHARFCETFSSKERH